MDKANLSVEAHAISHIGKIKKNNADNYLLLDSANSKALTSSQESNEFTVETLRINIEPNGIILAVSDGTGVAFTGRDASKIAVETVISKISDKDSDTVIAKDYSSQTLADKLYEASVEANNKIYQEGIPYRSSFADMGATFTGAAITDEAIDFVQVGDSRAYLVRDAQLYQLTKDQTIVQQLIDKQEITVEEAKSHPLKSIVLQILGAQNQVYPVVSSLIPCRDDIFLLCTDGLSNKVSGLEMIRIVLENSEDLKLGTEQLVNKANENGGEDNITVILAKISGKGLPESFEIESYERKSV
jgi:protein phosphatase